MSMRPTDDVEAVLLSHPGVARAAVRVRDDGGLVAAVVPAPDPEDDAADDGVPDDGVPDDGVPGGEVEGWDDEVAGWADVFDGLYADPGAGRFRGWIDRVTGGAIPAERMEAWRRGIVGRVRALGGRRLLEVGAGEGLLVPGLAAGVDEYWATDVSTAALDLLAARPGLVLRRLAAHDTTGLPAGHFDVVVVNSVVQYFPSADYLATVLHRLAALLAPGGAIVVGDVRALALGRLHHEALTVARVRGGRSAADLAVVADRALASEAELLVAPAFFDDVVAASPVLARAEAALPEHGDTEMSRYRYDVVLRTTPSETVDAPTLSWTGPDAWAEALRAGPPALVLAGVPNARLAADLAATAPLHGGRPVVAPGADPAALVATARACGYEARAAYGADDPYAVDVLAHRPGTPAPAHPPARPAALTNQPATAVDLAAAIAFADGLRAYAAAHLPPALVPAAVTVVSRLA